MIDFAKLPVLCYQHLTELLWKDYRSVTELLLFTQSSYLCTTVFFNEKLFTRSMHLKSEAGILTVAAITFYKLLVTVKMVSI